MITIICATHRPKNQTQAVVRAYKSILEDANQKVEILNMSDLPRDFIYGGNFGENMDDFNQIVEHKIVPVDRVIFISPEYNGSFPGVLKAFLDTADPSIWKGKKMALIGVASGRAGNLRGMDHLTSVLHYLKAEVFSNKIPISLLDNLLDTEGNLSDKTTLSLLQDQAQSFLRF